MKNMRLTNENNCQSIEEGLGKENRWVTGGGWGGGGKEDETIHWWENTPALKLMISIKYSLFNISYNNWHWRM